MNKLIQEAEEYVKELFKDEYTGHDYFHTMRVYKIAMVIAEKEKANTTLVALAALLHDADDRKISARTSEKKENAVRFLRSHNVSESDISAIIHIIDQVSFKGTDSAAPDTVEGCCVQDADRLDALGAIGIARAFAYGGSHNRIMYDPEEKPEVRMNREEYENHISTTVNHFYEKLFLLKELMNTEFGKTIAEKREKYMKSYLEQFMTEWESDDII